MKILKFLTCLIATAFVGVAQAQPRIVQDADLGWHFHLGDVTNAQSPAFKDGGWRALDVPHDWSIEGDYSMKNPSGDQGGRLPAGIGWYRRTIEMPADWAGKVVRLEFEGVYMNSTVWLNGVKVGGRPYGYSSFSCDLTATMKLGSNVLAVRVDDSLQPSARWYHGSGIYGHVRLIVTDAVHVPENGIFVRTPSVSADSATVSAAVEVKNGTDKAADAKVEVEVIAPDGRSLATQASTAAVAADGLETVSQTLTVPKPTLWSLENPALYTLKTRVLLAGKVVDEVATPFGIRNLRFDAKEGLFLNGKSVKLKGVCEHVGASPVGAAIPEALLKRRLQQLKEMGCNSIRAAHNPELPAFYELCDRMGILVMDEIFDGWHKKAKQDYGARFFNEWWQRDVTDWVRRDRNHPSVIFWSIGNETGEKDDNDITGLIHKLDDTRPTTGGSVIEGVDVAGFNGGILPNLKKLEDYHQANPERAIVLTEEPHTFQTRGFYRTVNAVGRSWQPPLPDYATPEVFSGGDSSYRSSYDNSARRTVTRNSWQMTADRPWVMGLYRWTGFDYIGEAAWAGKGKFAREFNFGVLDLAGFPKDSYYLYQSLWTEQPMIHVLPHWTHPGLDGKVIPVVAYANADEMELFQDGKSLGRQKRSALFECVWPVPYRPGELKAVAYRAGKAVAEMTQRTAGVPAKIQITTDNAALKPDRNDLALVSLAICDAQGTMVPDADQRIAVFATGPVRWLGGENGDPVDVTPQRETARKVFYGLSRGFYAGVDGKTDSIEVAALGILGSPYFDDATMATINCERVALRGALKSNDQEIRYTTDGSEPSAASALYSEPLKLTDTTTVKASIFQDGKMLATTAAVFTKGPRPVTKGKYTPGLEMRDAEDPNDQKSRKRKK